MQPNEYNKNNKKYDKRNLYNEICPKKSIFLQKSYHLITLSLIVSKNFHSFLTNLEFNLYLSSCFNPSN